MRILHFSDIHLRRSWRQVPWSDWPGKRLIGGLNLLFGRSQAFARAEAKMAKLAVFSRQQNVDLVIFTGDYTAMGTHGEFALAREAVAPLMPAPLGYVNVPGNHDIYVQDVLREKRFERCFGHTLTTDFPEYLVDGGPWPFIRQITDQLVVVGVNSARPNPQPWRSSGKIPDAQVGALRHLLEDPRLQAKCVLVITHYAPCLEGGSRDSMNHGLVNAAEFLKVCQAIDRGAILCGHVHRRYRVQLDSLKVPVFCAGSATKEGSESLWIYDIENGEINATAGRWEQDHYVLG